MPDRGNQISLLVVNNLKLAVFMFKMVEHCSRTCNKVCEQHICAEVPASIQAGAEKSDDIEAPKADKNNWAKAMKNIVLHLKLMREVRGVLLACMVCHIIKVHSKLTTNHCSRYGRDLP